MQTVTSTADRSSTTGKSEYTQQQQLYRVYSALNAPASRPALHFVITNLNRCLDRLFQAEPNLAAYWSELRTALRTAACTVQPMDRLHISALGSIVSKHRVWSFLGQLSETASDETLELLATEILLSIRLERTVRQVPILLAWQCEMRTVDEDEAATLGMKVKKYARRLKGELLSSCSEQRRGVAAQDLLFEAQLIGCLVSRVRNDSQKSISESGLSSLTPIELTAALERLTSEVKAGDVTSAIYLLAFRASLPWPLFLKIPFVDHRKQDCICHYDPVAGEFVFDLSRLFSDHAKVSGEAYVATSPLIRLRAPTMAAQVVNAAYCANPSAKRLGDLVPDLETASKLDMSLNSGAIKVTLPRLIASAGPSALRADIDRAVGSYLTLRFDQIDQSSTAYINISSDELIAAESQWFSAVGLDYPRVRGDAIVAVGANATPTGAAIAQVYIALSQKQAHRSPGRRTGIERLFLFHDAVATGVAFITALSLGARNESPMSIKASHVTSDQSQLPYRHKAVGPSRGQTLLPIPALLKAQLRLWEAHLKRMLSRIKKIDPAHSAIAHIELVLGHQEVPLIFLLSGGYRPISSDRIFDGLSSNLMLTRDFGRHFFKNAARKYKISHEATEAWMRHHTRKASTFSSTNMLTEEVWMSQMASAIDRELGSLRIRPLVGLGE